MKLRQNGIVSLMIRPAVFLAGGRAYMKLRQNGIVSFPIRLDARGQRRRSYETTKFLFRSNWPPWRRLTGLKTEGTKKNQPE